VELQSGTDPAVGQESPCTAAATAPAAFVAAGIRWADSALEIVLDLTEIAQGFPRSLWAVGRMHLEVAVAVVAEVG